MAGKRQFGRIQRLPSGRYRARYLGPDGLLHNAPTTFTAKADADAWLATVQADMVRGKWLPPDEQVETPAEVTVRDVCQVWHAAGTLRWRTRTALDHGKALDTDVLPALGDVPLRGLTPEAVVSWYAALPAVPSRRAHAYAALREAMNHAVTSGLLDRSPCTLRGAGRAPLRRETTKGVVVATPEQVAVMVTTMPDRLGAMVHLAGWGGLRIGEVLALRRRDVAPDGSWVRVELAVQWVDGVAVVNMPKTKAGVRTVHLPTGSAAAMVEHLGRHVGESPESLLFATRTGGFLLPSNVHRSWTRAREAAGVPTCRFHDLRHTSMTQAARAGASTAELMARAGHATADAAMIYQHAAGQRDRELAARLSSLQAGSR